MITNWETTVDGQTATAIRVKAIEAAEGFFGVAITHDYLTIDIRPFASLGGDVVRWEGTVSLSALGREALR